MKSVCSRSENGKVLICIQQLLCVELSNQNIKMGWFSDTIINHTEISTLEIRIVAGATVIFVVVLLVYLCLHVHGKFTKSKMRETAQREIRLNNINNV